MLANYTSFLEAVLALNVASLFARSYNASLLDFIFRPQEELDDALSTYENNRTDYSKQVMDDIESRKKAIGDNISAFKKTRSFPQLNLWMFLFSLVSLLLAGIENECWFSFSRICFCSLGIVTLVFLILGWIFGEKKRKNHWLAPIDFSKPRHTINAFFIYLLLSVLLGIFLPPTVLDIGNRDSLIWHIATLIFIILSVSNFVVYFIKMYRKIRPLRKEIKELSNVLKQNECTKMN
jgi:hypothetical protein